MYLICDYSKLALMNVSSYGYNRIVNAFIIASIIPVVYSCSADKQNRLETNSGRFYYVSNSGNDSNDGSRANPLKTTQKVNSLQLKPGDAVYFEGNQVYDGPLSLTLNGTEKDSVYVRSYGNGTAVINGGDSVAISLGGQYFSISNIVAAGSSRDKGNKSAGIQLIEARHASLYKLQSHGFQKAGVGLWNSTDIILDSILAYDNGFAGIYVEGTDVTKSKNIIIRNCTARDNPGDPTNLTNHSGNGILVGLSTNVLVERCVATNNGWDMPRIGNGPVGIWGYECDSLIIQYCISYGNRTQKGAKDGGGFDFDGGVRNSIMQYNLSYDNEGAGIGLFQYHGATPWYNNIIRYNISINDAAKTEGSGGIFVWSNDPDSNHLTKCYVYNNVVYSTHRAPVVFEPQSLNTKFYFSNNIFIGNGNLVNGPSSGEKFIGNAWWSPEEQATFRNFRTLQEWSAKTGQEKLNDRLTGIQANPLLDGQLTTTLVEPYQIEKLQNYKLKSNSPLKNKGINIEALYNIPKASTDLYGNKIPSGSAVEPGVYEIPE
ncbi:MAG: right-handed parallel beta-helix repeat-containing protein [Chitinophagaceae bacterium]|nr:right-handed parallel beta-helix repeat-containing protein [Chitinophagaceae bacterium]